MSSKPIKPGYQLSVTSWENDGDNYKTKVISGLSELETHFLIFLASAFGRKKIPGVKVSGNDENELQDFVDLWKAAIKKYPELAEHPHYQIPLPSEEQVELFDEFTNLRYDSPLKNDPKYASVKNYDCPAAQFNYFFNEFISELLDHPGEGYYDMRNFVRKCEDITVHYVPDVIEDVTNRFIN